MSLIGQFRDDDVNAKMSQMYCYSTLGLDENVLKGLEETIVESHSGNLTFAAIPLGVNGFDLAINGGTLLERRLVIVLVTLESFLLDNQSFRTIILCHDEDNATAMQSLIENIGRYLTDLKLFVLNEETNKGSDSMNTSHVIIGTPQAIENSIENDLLDTSSVNLFISDGGGSTVSTEYHEIAKQIFDRFLVRTQLILCSDTIDKDLVTSFSDNICMLQVNETSIPPLFSYHQYFVRCQAPALRALQMRAKSEKLNELLSDLSFTRCIVFCNYQSRVKSLSNIANERGFKSIAVSDKPSAKFTNGATSNIVFATDDTAAKIENREFDLVVNYDIPDDAIKFIDRLNWNSLVTGICINFITDDNDLKQLQNILSSIVGPKLYCTELSELKSSVSDIIQNDITQERKCILKDFQKNITIREKIIQRKTKKINKVTTSKHNTKSKNGKVKRKSVNNDVESCLANILKNVNSEVEELREQLSEMDTDSILQSLATGKVGLNVNGACDLDISEKNCSIEENTDKFDSLLQILSNAHPTTTNINSLTAAVTSTKPKEDIFHKNKALLDVSKIITGTDVLHSQDHNDSTIQMYLNDLKQQEQEEISRLEEKDLDNILGSLRNTDIDKNESTTLQPENTIELEDIFSFGYKSIIGDENSRWKMQLAKFKPQLNGEIVINSNFTDNDSSENELTTKSSDLNSDKVKEDLVVNSETEVMKSVPISNTPNSAGQIDDEDMTENVEIMKWVPVDKLPRKPKEAVKSSEQMDHISPKTLETSHSVNLPVDQSPESYQTYENYFNDCSQYLWNSALNFSDVETFDEWFYYDWEARLNSVRDYVQQNIYVHEMSQYQNDFGHNQNKS